MTDNPQPDPIELPFGVPVSFNSNRPFTLNLEFTNGTTVEGVIVPNSGLTICNRGDITYVAMTYTDDNAGHLALLLTRDQRALSLVALTGPLDIRN